MQIRTSQTSLDVAGTTGTERPIVSRLRRGAVEAFVLNGAGVGMVFLMNFVLARAIGARGYGVFSYTVTLVNVLGAVLPLGWPTALVRFAAQYTVQREWSLLNGIMRRAHQITLVTAVLAALALFACSFWSRIPSDLVISFRFGPLLLLPLAFVALRSKAFQSFQHVKASVLLEQIILPIIVIVGVPLIGITSARLALLVYSGAAILVFFTGSIWLWRTIPPEGRKAAPRFRTRAWMSVAVPIMLGGLGQMLLNRIDVLMIGAMLNPEAAGLYSAANRIARLNTFTLGAINTIAPPMLAAAYYGRRIEQFTTIMRKAMLWSTLGSVPLFAIAVFWPHHVLGLFGPEFTKAALLLRILAVGQFVNAATGPVGFALLMTGREKAFARTMSIAAVINVLGNWIAIRVWGVLGAAIVTSGTVAFYNAAMYLQVRNASRRGVLLQANVSKSSV